MGITTYTIISIIFLYNEQLRLGSKNKCYKYNTVHKQRLEGNTMF